MISIVLYFFPNGVLPQKEFLIVCLLLLFFLLLITITGWRNKAICSFPSGFTQSPEKKQPPLLLLQYIWNKQSLLLPRSQMVPELNHIFPSVWIGQLWFLIPELASVESSAQERDQLLLTLPTESCTALCMYSLCMHCESSANVSSGILLAAGGVNFMGHNQISALQLFTPTSTASDVQSETLLQQSAPANILFGN